MFGRKKSREGDQRTDKAVKGHGKLSGMLNLIHLLATRRRREQSIEFSLPSGKRYSGFPGESKFAFTPYPQMEVMKCWNVIKSVVCELDKGLVFPSSFQHWIRTERPHGPGGLNLFPPCDPHSQSNASLTRCYSDVLSSILVLFICKSSG